MRPARKTSVRIRRIGTKAINRYATIRRLRRLQSRRLLHQPMKRTRRQRAARTARYFRKLEGPALKLRSWSADPAMTKKAERRSSQERWFQTSLSVARMGVIVPSWKTLLYLNRCTEGSGSIWWKKPGQAAAARLAVE